MLRHIGLHEQRRLLRIHTGSEQRGGELMNGLTHLIRIGEGTHGVEIDDAEEIVEIVLLRHPVTDCAKIVADCCHTRWLNTAKYAWFASAF